MSSTESRTPADEALRQLAALTEPGRLASAEPGVSTLGFEDGRTLYLVQGAPSGGMVLWTAAGSAVGEDGAAVLRRMLQANLFWQGTAGGTLGLAPDDETVILARRLAPHELDGETLLATGVELVECATSLAEEAALLPLLATAEAPAPAEAGAPATVPMFGALRG